jgi:DNA-3-methyladenine glycosylase
MFAEGGIAYVYLCYGIHHLFNVVTGRQDNPLAVLVRAGLPLAGVDEMLTRRGRDRADEKLMAGPGTLSQALGIRTDLSGASLSGTSIWIEDHGIKIAERAITVGPRIGVDYAAEDAALPYRFVVAAEQLGQSLA